MKERTKLEKLVGKEFIYQQNNIRIKDYYAEEENGSFKIITDGKPITVKEAEIASFVDQLLPVEEPATQAISTEVVQGTNELMNTLQQTLLDNIKNVQKDKEYIKQANVVNSSVNALIGMAKLQLQVAKLKQGK